MNDKKKNTKNSWIQYSIFAAVAITLYATGLHTEVIGFAQRGLLATGLMNPDVNEIAQVHNDSNEIGTPPKSIKADFNFNLIDKDGNTISLKEMKGKVVFINLWATWCPPCIAEMPSIDELHDEMSDEVAFVILSMDRDFKTAIAFDKRKEYNLPIYAPVGNIPTMYQSSALPTTYVIDASGNLILTHKGMADYSDSEFKDFFEKFEIESSK